MAAVLQPSALLIGWAITGVGILVLAFAMLLLTRIRPDLDGGIFTYAREGIRRTIASAPYQDGWLRGDRQCLLSGYRLFGAQFFTDTPELRLFGDGNTLAVYRWRVGSAVVVHFLVLRGVQAAAGINSGHPRQLLPLGAFVALAALAFQLDTFASILAAWRWACRYGNRSKHHADHPVGVYRRGGAVVVSARARHCATLAARRCWRCCRRPSRCICWSPCCRWASCRAAN